ncbi:MAG TPA: amidohydrolase family protein [Acidimicrobiia bacterium]|nr:amidohydrolase family protein [Acidimicrobiia bacterium]
MQAPHRDVAGEEGGARPGLTLACARVVNGEGGVSGTPAWVSIAGGRVIATGTGAAPSGALDLGDALVAPGFLDLQMNGTGNVDFATATVDDVVAAVDALAARGTTGVLLTLCTSPLEAYDGMLERAAAVQAARPDLVLGAHLEGPFLGGAPGAHPVALLREADLAFLQHVCDAYGALVRVVTLAPEADPGLRAIRVLAERGVVVALGHSTVDFDGAIAAADAGARVVTHCFNGMGPLHHRAPGLAGAALTDSRLVPSLIADFVHVHPAVVKIALGARPDAVLVSDAVRDDMVKLPDGTLAGSTLTMDAALRNTASLGFAIGRAVRHVTANPARVLGLAARGRVAPGARADLVALDPSTFAVRAVWVAGAPV